VSLSQTKIGAAILVVAAVSLTAVVYLQILWDDRPVTYPLSALRFSRRGPDVPYA
jgi:hypothetical protein